MFLGHHAVGLATKNLSPRTSLGTLIAAATLLDLAWPFLLLAGVEHVRIAPGNTRYTPLDFYDYPWTHSALMVLLWSGLFGAIYRLRTRNRRGALAVAVLVFSHWLLDFIVHRPDLPLWPGGRKVGLGLWNSIQITIVVEVMLLLCGVWIYVSTTRPRDRIGSIGLWSYVIFLVVIFAANSMGQVPPSWQTVAWMSIAAWLFVPWTWWIDQHRELRT